MLPAALFQGGCYLGSAARFDPKEFTESPGWTFVTDVPFIRQRSDTDCGAAALAMTLNYWGVHVQLADLLQVIPVSRRGIKARALRDFARAQGLDAFVVEGKLMDLNTELRKRRPVVVGLVKRFSGRATTHYEVVVGINFDQKRLAMLDPAEGWRQDSWEGFVKEWTLAQSMTLVLFPRLAPAEGPRRD